MRPVPTSKAERLMDLVIALVNTPRYRTAAWVREHVAGYNEPIIRAGKPTVPPSDEAFSRMFERDKQELRDMGIPIDVEPGGDGYRIEPGRFALPPIALSPAESAALAVASRLWETTALGEAGGAAARKIRDAAGLPDGAADDGAHSAWTHAVQARLRTPEPSFADLLGAVRARRCVEFDYRGVADLTSRTRSVEPWGLVNVRGSWYLVGRDTDRDAQRTFRLSRITGGAQVQGRPDAFVVPPDLDLKAAVVADHGADQAAGEKALLRIRVGAAPGLRRIATDSSPSSTDGYDDVTVPMPSLTDLARRVAAHGADVVVIDPVDLRGAVIALLTAAAAA